MPRRSLTARVSAKNGCPERIRVDFQGTHVGHWKFSGNPDLPAENRSIINSAVQRLGLDIAGNFQGVGKEISAGRGRFRDFARFDSSIGQRDGAYDSAMMQIGNDENGADDALVFAPRRSDVLDGFVSARQPVAQHALNHR